MGHHRKKLADVSPAVTLHPDDFLTELEAAHFMHTEKKTLANWRWKRIGPRYFRIGQRLVRYRRADLLAFVEGGAGPKR